MNIYTCILILTAFAVAVGLWRFRKPKEYKYSLLDTSGIILNTVMSAMIYPPLCILCAFMATGEYTDKFPMVLEGVAVPMTRLMSSVCLGGIGASIILRRRQKSLISFFVQFAGIAWFCTIMLLSE